MILINIKYKKKKKKYWSNTAIIVVHKFQLHAKVHNCSSASRSTWISINRRWNTGTPCSSQQRRRENLTSECYTSKVNIIWVCLVRFPCAKILPADFCYISVSSSDCDFLITKYWIYRYILKFLLGMDYTNVLLKITMQAQRYWLDHKALALVGGASHNE
jgi:hypothetical protein